MESNNLFTMALGLVDTPWRVKSSSFSGEPKVLELELDFERGSRFACPECGELCAVHDTVEKRWRHLNFFQWRCDLVARVPRVRCEEHGVRQVQPPWARSGSGFTLMMEALMVLLCKDMSVDAAAELLGVHDTQQWRVLIHYVELAQQQRDWSKVTRVLIDETSARRGHRYVTNVVNADNHELLLMVEGRQAAALASFREELIAHGGDPEKIELIGMDMSPAYIKGATDYFPKAQIVFDFFHIMQLAGKAVDEVRKQLRRDGADLSRGLWAIRGNEWNRTEDQLAERKRLAALYPLLGRAIMLRDLLGDILQEEDPKSLQYWYWRACVSRLPAFKKLAKTIKEHWDGIVAFMKTRVTNGAIEAINGIIQLAKRTARGFRSFRNFRAIAYLKAAHIKINLPNPTPA